MTIWGKRTIVNTANHSARSRLVPPNKILRESIISKMKLKYWSYHFIDTSWASNKHHDASWRAKTFLFEPCGGYPKEMLCCATDKEKGSVWHTDTETGVRCTRLSSWWLNNLWEQFWEASRVKWVKWAPGKSPGWSFPPGCAVAHGKRNF